MKTFASTRRGLTLIELLVVIFITLLITAAAIPLMAPRSDERVMRQTATTVTTMLQTAQARAVELGRPCGIALERFPGLPDMCARISYVESQQPYAGDTDTSIARVEGGAIVGIGTPNPSPPPDIIADSGWLAHLLKLGDQVRFNSQGQLFSIDPAEDYDDANGNGICDTGEFDPMTDDENSNGTWDSNLDPDGHIKTKIAGTGLLEVSWKLWPLPSLPDGDYKFQILRQPDPTTGPPADLLSTAVIDLNFSGIGIPTGSATLGLVDEFHPSAPNDNTPVMIVFGPDGTLDHLYYNKVPYPLYRTRPSAPIHLMLGKRTLIPSNSEPKATPGPAAIRPGEPVYNWQDLTNLWVTIYPQTGRITTAEVHSYSGQEPFIDGGPPFNGVYDLGEWYVDMNRNGQCDNAVAYGSAFFESREYAREGKNAAGK